MTPIALTLVELALALLAAALIGGIAGYYLRSVRSWRAQATQPPAGFAPSASRAPEPTSSAGGPVTYPGLRRAERVVAPPDPWRSELPLDVEESLQTVSGSDRPTVLVVDDRLELRAVHSTYLQQHGYQVLLAADGESALELIRLHQPTVVVLDHSLPGRTGIEVTRELKRDPRTARIPVILMTAHSYGAIGMAARQAGVSAFLPKPVDPSRVLREVERHTRVDVHDA